MTDQPEQAVRASFFRSRIVFVLLGFLAIAGLLLVYEHRAHIFVGNWLLVAIVLLCPLMHLFMHGGHGGHGGGPKGGHQGHGDKPTEPSVGSRS